LNNRSPYEVVTGLRPKLPSAMVARFPVQEITVDLYVERLLEYLRGSYHRVRQIAQDAMDEAEQAAPGRLENELKVGDLVMRRLNPHEQKRMADRGPYRFTRTVDPRIYRVSAKVADQPFAYRLLDHDEPTRPLTFSQPVSRHRLVKLDMPELEDVGEFERRRVEVYVDHLGRWRPGTLESRMTLDGRVKIRWDDDPGRLAHIDLADRRYRWQVGEGARDWGEGPEGEGPEPQDE